MERFYLLERIRLMRQNHPHVTRIQLQPHRKHSSVMGVMVRVAGQVYKFFINSTSLNSSNLDENYEKLYYL